MESDEYVGVEGVGCPRLGVGVVGFDQQDGEVGRAKRPNDVASNADAPGDRGDRHPSRSTTMRVFRLTNHHDAWSVTALAANSLECADGVGAADSVNGEPHVGLKFNDAGRGSWTEDAIGLATIETQTGEADLELLHVVPAEVRRREIQHSCAEGPRRFHQGRPRDGVAFAR